MRNFIVGLIIGILIGGFSMYFIMKKDVQEIKIPIVIDVPVPVKDSIFDPIEDPNPLPPRYRDKMNPINKKLQRELDSAKTVLDSFKALKEFTIKRSYKEILEDDFQVITVDAETTGTLDKLLVGYETKPYTIPLDTSIIAKVPFKAGFYIGGSVLVPYKETNLKPTLKGMINLLNKKHTKIYNLQVDPMNESIEAGITFKL